MAKNLVIVESPAKAKTINKYLGKDFIVKASIGHIKDLPSKGLGVDIQNNFEPDYEIIPDSKKRNNKKIVSDLKKTAKEASAIYLAADPDREGEAICQHLAEEIVPKQPPTPAYRVMFNEITKRAVQEAFEHPKQIDENLVDAQQARRVLDRLVGYKVSPLLCRTIGGRLSAGRVQSVALRMVVEREREIEAFIKTEYWTIGANLTGRQPPSFDARLLKIGEKTVKTSGFEIDLAAAVPSPIIKENEIRIASETEANEIVAEAREQSFIVSEVTTKERKRNPVPAFITSKLQQEASRKLGFPVKRTMMIAQHLYEGIELGSEGSVGLITYMRTDSTRVGETALSEARQFIGAQYGQNYLPEKAVHYRSKKDAQDAHEAIRPTDVTRTPDALAKYLKPEELKLYRLIWQRFVASQMMPALFDQTTIDIQAGRFIFRATGSVLKFDGFLKVYQEGRDEKSGDEEDERNLPLVSQGETLELNKIDPEQHFTEPPARYTEATLVKALEEKGIGRPSTYAAIMTTIQDREYVEKKEGRFHPTALGKTVNDVLIEGGFDDLFNETYTARMEEELDEIEEGKLKWTDALTEFYDKFKDDLSKFQKYAKDIKEKETPTEEVCLKCGTAGMVMKLGRFGKYLKCPNCSATRDAEPVATPEMGMSSKDGADGEEEVEACELCGKAMQLKRGRFGPFYGCSGYPECRNIRKVSKSGRVTAPPEPIDEKCPIDGAQLVKRQGRFGEFISCSNYPKCKYIKRETTGIACPRPGCKGELIVKRSKRGKTFYGCSEYPKCEKVFWDKPVDATCPQCNAPFLLEKTTKKGTTRYCGNESCGYRSELLPPPSAQAPAPEKRV
jgi:DNA topoisomerase-1